MNNRWMRYWAHSQCVKETRHLSDSVAKKLNNMKILASQLLKDNTEKIRPIRIGEKRKGTDPCTPGEITSVRSVVASLAWVAR